MKRYKPTNDLLFKKSIGNANHPEIPLGLINDVLGIGATEAHIENPYDITVFRDAVAGNKLLTTEVDVRVRLQDGSQVLVEIQLPKQEYFFQRVLYYAASRYTADYGSEVSSRHIHGEKYGILKPVHSINVLGYVQFPLDSRALRSYVLYDTQGQHPFGADGSAKRSQGFFTISFLELAKRADENSNIAHWIDYFSGSDLAPDAPDYIVAACELSRAHAMSKEEIEMFDAIEYANENRACELNYARREGREEGLAEGREEGLTEGREEGLAEGQGLGAAQAQHEIARKALAAGLPIETIQQITGLERKAIEGLLD